MKVSLPTHVPMRYVYSFALAMLGLELAEGTSLLVGLMAQAFIIVAALAFNTAGGLMYPSGAFIFFNALFSLGLGTIVKTALGEPLDSNLIVPAETMLVYLVGMVFMAIAVFLSTRLRSRKGLLQDVQVGAKVDQISIGCVLIALWTPHFLPDAVQGTFSQFNLAFVYLAIVLPVYQTTKDTDGRSSFNLYALIAWAYLTGYYGLFAFSKQGIFAPSAAWIVSALAAGYRTSFRQLAILGTAGFMASLLLTPYSQIGRNYRGEADPGSIAVNLLMHPFETRALYNEQSKESYSSGYGYHWFDEPMGLVDRLSTVPIDDALIFSTDHFRTGSPDALWSYVLNIVPKYLYPNKPTLTWGNVYGHDIGLVGEGDNSTGISFTAYADGYHTAGWLGDSVILSAMFFVMFVVCDSVAGSLAKSQWGLVYLLYFTHAGAEGMLGVTMYAATVTTASLIGAAYISTRIAPLVGSFVTLGRNLRRVRA